MNIAKITGFIKEAPTKIKKTAFVKLKKPITSDVCEFSNSVQKTKKSNPLQKLSKKFQEIRWNNPYKNYSPNANNTCVIEMHHEVNGSNGSLRSAYKKALTTDKLDDIHEQRSLRIYLEEMKEIDENFAKLPPLEKDCIVYRGRAENPCVKRFNADFPIVEKAKVGDVITPDTGYSYCGFKKSLAKNWANPAFKETKTTMYEIRLPKGSQVSRNLEHGGEVLMPRNAQYKVIDKKVQDNHTDIILEYILPKKSQNLDEVNSLIKKLGLER